MTGYRVEVTADDNGTLLITCPAFPEVTTFAEDEEHIPARARAAIEEAIAARIAAAEKVPAPERAGDPRRNAPLLLLHELKVLLYLAARRQHVSRAELARRLHWHREQVDRLFRLNHQSKVEQIETAFRALGQRLDVRIHAE
jgi:antitoxin HicB